jgi:hypothetical protein
MHALQVVYGADKQSWASVRSALRKGEVKDGEVTLILERRSLPRDSTAAAAPVSALEALLAPAGTASSSSSDATTTSSSSSGSSNSDAAGTSSSSSSSRSSSVADAVQQGSNSL